MAELIVARVPSVEMVRLVNSGTEATMTALRLARAFTGRPKVVKFSGCYHGHADAFLVKAGSGAATLGTPTSPGVPASVVADTLTRGAERPRVGRGPLQPPTRDRSRPSSSSRWSATPA